MANGGWDNWTFHLGPDLLVRLPSAAEYALAVDKEHRWLPVLAARLPLPVPTPVAKGKPTATWARGRGWALWKTLATCAYTYGARNARGVRERAPRPRRDRLRVRRREFPVPSGLSLHRLEGAR
ncbi:phosphotransferase [Solwaraspora sp. WMMD406]|uniref:phosphotransferase n=1 Tax=Solwaraspora sp. WMMD406 TaxID=3016095 RepID=UPI0024179C1C|nr:phosphotransferase [Solwaraspora sp. WMMD406]MDG4766168.1 phosphotransferase [Solwaraspora sp. WMMD406]